eukprot:TRINITY_DN25503_c0_g1_i1.p1 TRINITY_DN25503_c0_g1~~TRINITY_DN25503_c0_g1_i1.p1  ORF type:complete len:113 (+),score=57.37 TRINITY_DN25503_c0_g1_i1:44-340(+)
MTQQAQGDAAAQVEQRIRDIEAETERLLAPLEKEMAARESLRCDRDDYIKNLNARIASLEKQAKGLNSIGSNNALNEIMLMDELMALEKTLAELERQK